MAAEFFGLNLLERGTITREALLEAVSLQSTVGRPLCAEVIEKGMLSPDQMAALEERQAATGRGYLELALLDNMIMFQDLEALTRKHPERAVWLAEVLLRRGHVGLREMSDAFAAFARVKGSRMTDLDVVLGDIRNRELVKTFLRVTVDLFLHYTDQVVKADRVYDESPRFDEMPHLFSQKVTGRETFYFVLAIPDTLACSIASHIMGEPCTVIADMAEDAVCEFVNVAVGHGCSEMASQRLSLAAKPPELITREKLGALRGHGITAADMRTTQGDFCAVFYWQD